MQKLISIIDSIIDDVILSMIFIYGLYTISYRGYEIFNIPAWFVICSVFAYPTFKESFIETNKAVWMGIFKVKEQIDKEAEQERLNNE
jgi:hypothetical protein